MGTRRLLTMRLFASMVVLAGVLGLPGPAARGVDLPANPPVPATRAATPPDIDGALDDACWKQAPRITGFTHDTRPALLDSEVMAAYDSRDMYFAFICHDPLPNTIRAQQRRRNGDISSEDYVSVGIDPRLDKRQVYWFSVTALGTQADDIPGGAAAKVQWRGDWRAAVKRTADGWTAEIAVPFAFLHYPPGQNAFGLMFERNVPRLSEASHWPVNTSYGIYDNEARWTGLEAPRIVRRPLVMPYVLAGTGTIKGNAGVDVKHVSENNFTSLLTIRPDFATIEDVVDTIDFSYNPRYLRDPRPFFAEGSAYFEDPFLFYSRTIGEVDAGVKTFGMTDRWTLVGLGATRHDGQSVATGGFAYHPNPSYEVFAGLVGDWNRRATDPFGAPLPGRNTVLRAGADASRPMAVGGIKAYGNFYRSQTSDADALGLAGGRGTALNVGADRFAGDGVPEWHLRYSHVSPDYNAQLGFLPERGFRGVEAQASEGWLVKSGPLRRVSTTFDANQFNYWQGGLWHRSADALGTLEFRNNTSLSGIAYMEDRHLAITPEDAAALPFFHDRFLGMEYRWRTADLYRQGGLLSRAGRVAGGPYSFVTLRQAFRLSDKLSGGLEASRLRLKGLLQDITTNRAILSGLYEFTDERSVSIRFIVGTENSRFRGSASDPFQPNRIRLNNGYAAYRQQVRRGADIFVLLGDPNTEGIRSQVAVKYVTTW